MIGELDKLRFLELDKSLKVDSTILRNSFSFLCFSLSPVKFVNAGIQMVTSLEFIFEILFKS